MNKTHHLKLIGNIGPDGFVPASDVTTCTFQATMTFEEFQDLLDDNRGLRKQPNDEQSLSE